MDYSNTRNNLSRGYILLYRSLSNDPFWTSEPFTQPQAWVDLIFLAEYKNNRKKITSGKKNTYIDLCRGEVGVSKSFLSKRWQWSNTKVDNFLKNLSYSGQIELKSFSYGTKITLMNYEEYQAKPAKQNMSKNGLFEKKERNQNLPSTKPITPDFFEQKRSKNVAKTKQKRTYNKDNEINKFSSFSKIEKDVVRFLFKKTIKTVDHILDDTKRRATARVTAQRIFDALIEKHGFRSVSRTFRHAMESDSIAQFKMKCKQMGAVILREKKQRECLAFKPDVEDRPHQGLSKRRIVE